jgi:hypothetical protein
VDTLNPAMSGGWSSRFKNGDLVEYVGPESENQSEPRLGERGTIIGLNPPDGWVVSWERITSVQSEMWLRLVNPTETPPRG